MLSKRMIIILVIIAIILASISIAVRIIDSGDDVSTENKIGDTGSGQIGIQIVPPPVEDKNAEEG